ncbi:MAG TPA: hypothetical protein DIT25_04540 [Candidatus Moranbacteria bacterium]|nr:hypothetical protein [Candidatus Moranbacteria bacterium]
MYKFGAVQKKIVLALLGGVALGLSSSPDHFYKNFRKLRKEWGKINQQNFNRSIKKLADRKLIEERKLANGSFKLVLTSEGVQQAKTLSLLGSSINFKKPKKWDGKWRIVIFDIPEKERLFRDILRDHLKELEFFKLQQSVFASPYPFEKPILELVSLYSAEPYVRVITALKIDNEEKIKKHFKAIK